MGTAHRSPPPDGVLSTKTETAAVGDLRSPEAIQGAVRLGLRANLGQFALLVGVNALVGGMLGQERTVLPLLADHVFHLRAFTAALTFIVRGNVSNAVQIPCAANAAAGT